MSSAITAALEAAKAKAAEAVAAAGVPATVPTGGAAGVPAMAPTRRLTMDDVQPNLAVDKFLKTDLRGLKIDDKIIAEDGIVVTVNLPEVNPVRVVKWQVGTTPMYARSHDGVHEAGSTKPWGETIAKAQQIDPRVRGDYPAAEIPMTLVEPAKTAKGEVLAEAGTTLGYTTSTTGHALFMKVYNEARNKGLPQMVLRAQSEAKRNPKTGQDYAVITWELLG